MTLFSARGLSDGGSSAHPFLRPAWLVLLLLLTNLMTMLATWTILSPTSYINSNCPMTTTDTAQLSATTPLHPLPLSAWPDGQLSPDLCDASTGPYPLDIPSIVRRYCNAANSTTFPYRRPQRYRREDMAVTLLTVDIHKHTRDEAVMHSWLTPLRLPFGYFGVSIERPTSLQQPTLPIPLTSDIFVSNLNKTFISLRELYLRFPTKHWFVQTSDDAYFDADALLLKLDAFDSDDVLYVGGAFRPDWPCWPTGHNISYVGGGSGFALSRGFMRKFAAEIEPWMTTVWLSPHGYQQPEWMLGDIMVGCFADQHGLLMTHIRGGHGAVPAGAPASDRDFPAADHRWWAWHYVPVEEMVDVDLFFALQRIDQVERHVQWRELAAISREAAVEHHWQQKRSLALLAQCHGG